MISGSSCLCRSCKDNTTAEINEMGFIERVPDRNKLWAIQTPQGFKKEILIEAHKKLKKNLS